MKDLPVNVIIEKNKLSTNKAWLVLLDITLTNEEGTILRFVNNNEDVNRLVEKT